MSLASIEQFPLCLTETSTIINQHKLLENVIVEHEKSCDEVCYYANQLAAGDHIRSGDLLLAKVEQLQGQWGKLKSEAEKRQNLLQQVLQAQEFYSEISESEVWMGEQEMYLTIEDTGNSHGDAISLLTLHLSYTQSVTNFKSDQLMLASKADELASTNQRESEKLTETMTSFQSTYDRLLETATKRMDKLEESCEMFLHLEDIEDFKKWLAQKQVTLLSNEQAESVEEAMTFLNLFLAAKRTVVKLGNDKVNKITTAAEELLGKWPSCDRTQVTEGLQSVNESWEQFERDLLEHEEELKENLKLLQYLLSVKCLTDYIHEVEASISKDVGNNFVEVKLLLQSHGELCYTMEALSQQTKEINAVAQQLMEETLEEQADSIEMASMELDASYEKLQNIMGLRQKHLIDSHKLQCFLSISNYLLEWYGMMNEEIVSTKALGSSVSVQEVISNHESRILLIEGRQKDYDFLQNESKQLCKDKHYASDKIKQTAANVTIVRAQVLKSYDEKLEELKIYLEAIQQYEKMLSIEEALMGAEADVNVEEITGDRLSVVEELLDKLNELETNFTTMDDTVPLISPATRFEHTLTPKLDSSNDTHTQSQVITAKVKQTLGMNNEEIKSTDSKKLSNEDNVGAKADGDHPSESVVLSSGKPLRGILKHRRHTDSKIHARNERTVAMSEGGADISISIEAKSPEKSTMNESIVDNNSEPVTPPHNDPGSTKEEEPPGAAVNSKPLKASQSLSDPAILDGPPEHELSPSNRTRVHFAEDPAVVVGTGAGPSDDDEDEDSDQYYERMDSPSPPLITAQVNAALSSYKEKMAGENEQPNENTKSFTQTTSSDTTSTTERSVELVSNSSSVTASGDKEITRSAEESPRPSPSPTSSSDNNIFTSDNSSTTGSDDSSIVPAAKPQAKTPVKRYHSFSSAESRLSMSESSSSNQLGLQTLERHEGHIHRKHEMDSATKKASSRSWHSYHTVVYQVQLSFYKDHKHALMGKPSASSLYLKKANCEKAEDYVKRKHVFRVRLENGAEYLFQADNEAEMNGWIKHIQMNIALESTQEAQEASSPTQALEYPVYKKKGSKLYGKK